MSAERLMVAFAGTALPDDLRVALAGDAYAGVTLFRHWNVASVEQLRELTGALQGAARVGPLLIATDQEGGQLNALGDGPTPFAGAMALGAVADEDLAERVGAATGRELRALGVNVNYAPVCDLATNPRNPALGIRCFGDDPQAVGRLAAATVRGLQSAGVAATVKHFPGLGDAPVDTHHDLAVVGTSRDQLESRELVPFRAAIAAGARLAMAGHIAVPALTGDASVPASLSPAALRGVLREELGFDGLTITDALDMAGVRAIGDADPLAAALAAGEDLLLGTPVLPLVGHALRADDDQAPTLRLAALRRWLRAFDQPDPGVVGSAEHRALADELARRSITLVCDDAGLLPLRLSAEQRVLVIQPKPNDLTPADTTSTVPAVLAAAIRRRHGATDSALMSVEPDATEIAVLRTQAARADVVILGTDAAHLRPGQAELARSILALGVPCVTVALRTPWDITAYPESASHVCAYGILAPTIEALAAALFGEQPFWGNLPVALQQAVRS
ncbi:MAG: glycoside hydrolase family 3 N-terminal domain-containing protein [Chloroflexota bacterium]|nr:glycoside hydrolase family 3 N-terminal domain-containing protein [Chloroflexota bacterium]